ncbi:hypothetical protein V8E36_000580 [Tilletia maclaganii]
MSTRSKSPASLSRRRTISRGKHRASGADRDAASSVLASSSDHPRRASSTFNSSPAGRRHRFFSVPAGLKATLCTFEGTRDFCARERTFFSWYRMSTTLMVLAGALFLRLQLQQGRENGNDVAQTDVAVLTISQRRALRRILQVQLEALTFNSTSPTPFHPSSDSLPIPASHFPLSPNKPIPSIVLGALFSILSFTALIAGLYDFLRCSRCLELFDHYGAIQASQGFGHGPTSASPAARSPALAATAAASTNGAQTAGPSRAAALEAAVPEGYDAAQAVEAHSGRVVRATTVVIATSILIVAVLFITDEFLS